MPLHLPFSAMSGELPTEGLSLVADGSDDIAVGISGFGSAQMPDDRWRVLFDLTGRTTYSLKYDAQHLAWEDVPKSMVDLAMMGPFLYRKWTAARMAAASVSQHLSDWIGRWTSSGRRVLVVGFSLGGYVAWRACRDAANDKVDLVLISSAVGDQPQTWDHAESMGSIINVFSRNDSVLKWLYPVGVNKGETPAAGLGPLCIDYPNVKNIDVTDLIGWDHLWASAHLDKLLAVALAHLQANSSLVAPSHPVSVSRLTPVERVRLASWMVADVQLWSILGLASSGDAPSIVTCRRLDVWASREDRKDVLSSLGTAARVLQRSRLGQRQAKVSYRELSGLLRLWISMSASAGVSAPHDVAVTL